MQKSNIELNTILCGPPGTGKTYHTTYLAVEIINPDFYSANSGNYKKIKERFDKLKKEGRIESITFHQNFTYEDFIEGIKPVLADMMMKMLRSGIR